MSSTLQSILFLNHDVEELSALSGITCGRLFNIKLGYYTSICPDTAAALSDHLKLSRDDIIDMYELGVDKAFLCKHSSAQLLMHSSSVISSIREKLGGDIALSSSSNKGFIDEIERGAWESIPRHIAHSIAFELGTYPLFLINDYAGAHKDDGVTNVGEVKSCGGSSSYYDIKIINSTGESIDCSVVDIIRALCGNDFSLGNIVKAVRRIHEKSEGRGKSGTTIEYDLNKIRYFTDDIEGSYNINHKHT